MTSLHSYWIWSLYGTGLVLHALVKAFYSVRSKQNGISGYRQYVANYWAPLMGRAFLDVMAFVIVWDNPALLDLENLKLTVPVLRALAGVLGWFSDSLMDKVVALIPGAQKEVPAATPDMPSGGGTDAK